MAAGLAGGLASDSAPGGGTGAGAGKNAVENNSLGDIAQAQAEGKTLEQKAGEQVEAENERYRKANCGGMSAEACSVKMYTERREALKDTASLGADFLPVVGTLKSAAEAQSALDYLMAAASLIPGERVAAGIFKAAEKALVKGNVAEASKLINKASDEVTSANYFRQERKYWSAEPVNINGNKVYQRNDLFDPNAVDSRGRSNIQRMEKGLAPLDANGQSINLHHMLQKQDGPIAEVTQSFHKDNHSVIHINDSSIPSGIDRNEFNKWRSDYWKQRSNDFKK